MGAAAWGNYDRNTNPFYAPLRAILQLAPDGQVHINRDLANWPRNFAKPYTKDLIRILGEPIALKDMWNPDAMLRVEDIRHKEDTQERLDKAAATQMVFEDALIHIIDHLIRTHRQRPAGADRRHRAQRRRQHAAARAFRRGLLPAPVRPPRASASVGAADAE